MNIWLCAGALMLSVGWLIPTHQPPWTTFHSDAWVASTLLVFSLGSLTKLRVLNPWSHFALLVAVLSLVPSLQLAFGQIRLTGTAWISCLYLLGFLLAIVTGARWESGQAGQLADALFLAISVAATASVGVQLCQWLNVAGGCLCSGDWVLSMPNNLRIGANLAQPNQLATLLLLGILAYARGWVRQTIGSLTAIFAIIFLLFGLALTESRMGVLSLSLMLLSSWYWRRLWPSTLAPHAATLLMVFFTALFTLQAFFANRLLLDYGPSVLVRMKGDTRLDMWNMFYHAAVKKPWLGYGWNQSLLAQLTTTSVQNTEQSMHREVTSYAHNLFIDLMLWLGIPLGLLISAAALTWLMRAASHVKNNQDALLVMGVTAMGVHAMLELPLYYAYFLLPLGLMIGMIDVRLHHRPVFTTGTKPLICLWFVCSGLFVTVVKEYFVIEQSYSEFRIEASRITSKSLRQPPEVLILTQLRDFIILASLLPESNMSQERIDWITDVTLVYPSEHNLLKLATALALNGQEMQALDWLGKLCNLYPGVTCTKARADWGKLQNQFPHLLKARLSVPP